MCLIIEILYFIICNIFQNDWFLTTFFGCRQTSVKKASVWQVFFQLLFLLLLCYLFFLLYPLIFVFVSYFFCLFFYFLKIPRQIKGLRSSRKVRKLVEIQKSNKLVLSKKYISLKTRGSEKLPHSKCNYSRLSFCNQLSNTHVSVITLSNYKYRRKNSQRITVRSSC